MVAKKRSKSSKIARAKKRISPVKQSFRFLKILVYGRPKRGKTTFAVTGPKPVLIIDCNERGTLSVRNVPNVDVFRMDTWADIDLAYWYLHSGDHKYKTVVIDTVTSLAILCMKFVLGDEVSRDPTRDPEMPSRPIWGKVGELMKTQILQFRGLPMHVVFLAQERRGFSEDDEEAPEIFPDVSPTVRGALTPAVDIIGRIYVKEVVKKVEINGKTKNRKVMDHRLWIGPHEVYTTGDRSNSGLPRVLSNPNLTTLIKRIREYKEA